jgi:hypothetical protein
VNKILFGLALGCLVPVISAPAWAGFQEGADAYGKGDYQTALNEWLPIAQGGNAQAENAVGALYDNGLGVVSDEAEAFRWYSMAADQNFPLAMRNLGTMYATGHGVPYSLQQAQLWLGRAAGAGDRIAGKRLEALPPVGSTPTDPIVTPLAASNSSVGTDASSTNTSGFGTTTGPSSLLAQTSQPAAQQTGDAAASQPAATSSTSTADNTAQGSPSAPLTFPQAPAATTDGSQAPAAQASGSTTSGSTTDGAAAVPTTQVSTASSATDQTGSETAAATDAGTVADGWHAFDVGDYKTALTIWQPLAQNGDSNLQVLVGSLYDYGQGVPQDRKQALTWYLAAAQKGSGRGQYAAGSLLVKDAKQRDLVEAYKWLTIAGDTLKGQGGNVAANQALSLRQQISKEMSKDDIAKAETLAQSFHATS